MASAGRSYSWNSIAEFDIDIAKELSDNELVWLVKVAYEEMVRTYQTSNDLHLYKGIRMPGAVSLIAVGCWAYLASSIKGGANYIEINGNYKVRGGLAQCGADYGNHPHHRTHGNCGEQASAELYFQTNPNQSLTGGKV